MRPPKKILIAARLLLGQTQAELAQESGLGVRTIYNAEHGSLGLESVEKLVAHFEKQGIEFVKPEAGRGWGVFNHTLFASFDDEKRRKRMNKNAVTSL
jgi:transcriptional regulator with XRE-family HTH domain